MQQAQSVQLDHKELLAMLVLQVPQDPQVQQARLVQLEQLDRSVQQGLQVQLARQGQLAVSHSMLQIAVQALM